MADAQYICPQCGKKTARRKTYYGGSKVHRCTRCRKKNVLQISGSEVFCPRVCNVVPYKEIR